jgi:hypothetical protein
MKITHKAPKGRIKMDYQKSDLLKSKQKYLRLIYNITKQIITGSNPSDEMIKEARELGRRVAIPEEELKNLGLINLHQAAIH